MKLAELIDRVIEPFDPARVRRRLAERAAVEEMRSYYNATSKGRRGRPWRRTNASAEKVSRRELKSTRDIGYDLVRTNKYALAIDLMLTAHIVGDGIGLRAIHPVKRIQKAAQKEIDTFFASKVDGRSDFYGREIVAVSAMIVGGDAVVVWSADDHGPDGRCRVLEGAYLDETKNVDVAGQNRIIQGVEFDSENFRCAYWIFDRHPGDDNVRANVSRRYEARDVDHIFEERRAGQVRGVSWLAPLADTLYDIADTADAKLMQEKVASCLALVLTGPESGGPASPFDEAGSVGASASGSGGREGRGVDTIRPGMVMRSRPGETVSTVNPPSSSGGQAMIKQELMGIAAVTVPYHILSGDPSQANFSSLRATTNPFHARLDVTQQHTVVPHLPQSAGERRMRRMALRTGEKRFLEVQFKPVLPIRRTNDPIKDFAGELMEMRAGTKSMVKSLTERGVEPEEHIAEIAAFLKLTDAAGLVLDSDPRRVNSAGALQPPAGYLYKDDESQAA